jgi:SAM-dependent methyltransferase
MNNADFDMFADEYQQFHRQNVRISGETPEFFHEYKVKDTAGLVAAAHLRSSLRILDFGAGVGNAVPYFHQHLPGCHLTCLDVSRKSLAVAEQRFPGQTRFVAFDGEHSAILTFHRCPLYTVGESHFTLRREEPPMRGSRLSHLRKYVQETAGRLPAEFTCALGSIARSRESQA